MVVMAVVLLNISLRNRFWPDAMSVLSPLLCLIVVYLKSVPKGNFFLPGYWDISLGKGIKQFCFAAVMP